MHFKQVDTIEGFRKLAPSWNRLLASSPDRSVFLGWKWLFTWWEQYRTELRNPELFIVVGFEGDQPVLIFPGFVEREPRAAGGATALRLLGSRFEPSDYLTVIGGAGVSGSLPALTDHIRSERPDIDLWRIWNVLDTDRNVSHLGEAHRRRGGRVARVAHRTCPYLELSGTWSDYVETLSRSQRHLLRRRRRRLLGGTGARFDVATDPAQALSSVEELFRLHARRWRARGIDSTFLAHRRKEFHMAVSRRMAALDQLRMFRLIVGDETVACLYGFRCGDEFFYFQSGLDPQWDKLSAGFVLMGKCIEHCFDNALRRFDFMRGKDRYKFGWTRTARRIEHVDVGVSRRGRVIVNAERLARGLRRGARQLLRRRVAAPPEGGKAWN